jgi:hypothetical protein
MAATSTKKQFVVTKQGKYATATGNYGIRPKVYDSAAAAKYDIDTKPRLAGGVVMPYTTETKAAFDAEAGKVNAAAAKAPGKAPGPVKAPKAPAPAVPAVPTAATPADATADNSAKPKAKKGKARPKRAAAGK